MDFRDVILSRQVKRSALSGNDMPHRIISAVVIDDVLDPESPIRCKDRNSRLEFVATAWNLNGAAMPASGDSAHLVQSSDGTYICVSYGTGAPVSGKMAIGIGDGVASSFVVTHGLGTRDIIAVVRRATAPYDAVTTGVTISATTVDTATVDFGAVVPTSNQFRVTILG